MTSRPQLKTEQLDMDSFFDFSGTNGASPTTASTSRADVMSPFDKEEQQQFNGPSHDYGQFKQQVGLPVGSLANMPQPGMFDGFNSGIDTDFNSGFGWNSGLDMDSEMTMDFNSQQSMFYPTDSPSANFVDPNSIGGQEPASNVGRLWPGMHSQQAQQAAMQKAAQAQALQQRQMKLQAQQAQYRQAANTAQPSQGSSQHGKRASHVTEPHVEESISRLLNQMRQNNNAGTSEDGGSPSDVLPHIARMKKDEEEMDEDERLLASDEGKKLSSKERRQLRNKVSARAFRSRRKEYIGQLEGEVAMKTQESNTLRQENQALMQENERYRGLIETLLRHPAFTPFINDISKDPSSLINSQIKSRAQQQQQAQQQPPVPTPQPNQAPQPQPQPQQDMKPDFLNFDASQLQIPQPQPEQQQVNLAAIPEENFSKLNINGYRQPVNFNFNQVNAYPVTSLPRRDPIELLATSPTFFSCSASASASSPSDSGLAVLLAKLDNAANSIAI